jgi:hypothetical protein
VKYHPLIYSKFTLESKIKKMAGEKQKKAKRIAKDLRVQLLKRIIYKKEKEIYRKMKDQRNYEAMMREAFGTSKNQPKQAEKIEQPAITLQEQKVRGVKRKLKYIESPPKRIRL